MGAAGVIVDPPRLDDGPGRRQAPEQMLVQALVAQAPVQALDKTVLLRLAGRDVRGRLRERAKSYAKALANDILR